MKSVLKKIGEAAMAASSFIPIYGPAIRATVVAISGGSKHADSVEHMITSVGDGLIIAQNIVLAAEAAGNAISVPGAQKAAMTAPALHQLLMTLPLLQGKKPKDATQAMEKAKAVGGALADYFNQFED